MGTEAFKLQGKKAIKSTIILIVIHSKHAIFAIQVLESYNNFVWGFVKESLFWLKGRLKSFYEKSLMRKPKFKSEISRPVQQYINKMFIMHILQDMPSSKIFNE